MAQQTCIPATTTIIITNSSSKEAEADTAASPLHQADLRDSRHLVLGECTLLTDIKGFLLTMFAADSGMGTLK